LFLVEEWQRRFLLKNGKKRESIARLKIEHKQGTKCANLQHFALSDGKNPRKYHSFCP